MHTPEQRLTAVERELEKIVNTLDPATRNAERGELMILAARVRQLRMKMASKST